MNRAGAALVSENWWSVEHHPRVRKFARLEDAVTAICAARAGEAAPQHKGAFDLAKESAYGHTAPHKGRSVIGNLGLRSKFRGLFYLVGAGIEPNAYTPGPAFCSIRAAVGALFGRAATGVAAPSLARQWRPTG